MRVRCKTERWLPWSDLPDPELTKGRYYTVLDSHVETIAGEPRYSLVGDSGAEIQRPKHVFATLPEIQRNAIRTPGCIMYTL